MYWWHWIISYLIIGAGIAFIIIPNKTILFTLLIVIFIAAMVGLSMILPWKDETFENQNKRDS